MNWLLQWDTWRSARSNVVLLDTKLAFEDAFVRTYYVCFGRNSVTTTELSGAERLSVKIFVIATGYCLQLRIPSPSGNGLKSLSGLLPATSKALDFKY